MTARLVCSFVGLCAASLISIPAAAQDGCVHLEQSAIVSGRVRVRHVFPQGLGFPAHFRRAGYWVWTIVLRTPTCVLTSDSAESRIFLREVQLENFDVLPRRSIGRIVTLEGVWVPPLNRWRTSSVVFRIQEVRN